jgi:hypothetical protein
VFHLPKVIPTITNKTIKSVLKVTTYIITTIAARLIRFARLLVIISVLTLETAVILYNCEGLFYWWISLIFSEKMLFLIYIYLPYKLLFVKVKWSGISFLFKSTNKVNITIKNVCPLIMLIIYIYIYEKWHFY